MLRAGMSMRDVPLDYGRMFIGLDGADEPVREEPERRRGLFRRLRENLSKSRRAIPGSLAQVSSSPTDTCTTTRPSTTASNRVPSARSRVTMRPESRWMTASAPDPLSPGGSSHS